MLKEFLLFLKEYNIVNLALAFVMGSASTALVKSLVDDMIMPFIAPLTFGGVWREAALNIGPISMKWGSFLAELINFAILAFVVFCIAKKILKEKEVKKK